MTGQSVLIHGAAEGVGSIAVQLAHEVGARGDRHRLGRRPRHRPRPGRGRLRLPPGRETGGSVTDRASGSEPLFPALSPSLLPAHCVVRPVRGRGLLYGPGRGGTQDWSGASAEVSDAEWFAGRQGDLVRSREGVGSIAPSAVTRRFSSRRRRRRRRSCSWTLSPRDCPTCTPPNGPTPLYGLWTSAPLRGRLI